MSVFQALTIPDGINLWSVFATIGSTCQVVESRQAIVVGYTLTKEWAPIDLYRTRAYFTQVFETPCTHFDFEYAGFV